MLTFSKKKLDESVLKDLIQINADDVDIQTLLDNEDLYFKLSYGSLSKYNTCIISAKNSIDEIRKYNLYADRKLIKHPDLYKNYKYNRDRI